MPTEVSGLIPLFLGGDEKPSGTMTLAIRGPGLSCAWEEQRDTFWEDLTSLNWEDWPCSAISTGIESGSRPFYVLGATSSPYSGMIPLYLSNTQSGVASGSIDLYLQTEEPFSGVIPLYLHTDVAPTASLDFYTKGGDAIPSGISTGSLTLATSGNYKIAVSGNIPLYLNVVSTGTFTDNVPLVIVGENAITGSLNLYLENVYVDGSTSLFITGYWTVFDNSSNRQYAPSSLIRNASIPALRAGGTINSASTILTPSYRAVCPPLAVTCYDEGIFDEVLDSRTGVFSQSSKIGAIPAVSTLPLFLSHTIGVSTGITLFTEGITSIENSMNLMISGALHENNNMTLFCPAPSGFEELSMPLVTIGAIGNQPDL